MICISVPCSIFQILRALLLWLVVGVTCLYNRKTSSSCNLWAVPRVDLKLPLMDVLCNVQRRRTQQSPNHLGAASSSPRLVFSLNLPLPPKMSLVFAEHLAETNGLSSSTGNRSLRSLALDITITVRGDAWLRVNQ